MGALTLAVAVQAGALDTAGDETAEFAAAQDPQVISRRCSRAGEANDAG